MTIPKYDTISVVPVPPEGYQVVTQVDAIDMSPEITYSHHVPLWDGDNWWDVYGADLDGPADGDIQGVHFMAAVYRVFLDPPEPEEAYYCRPEDPVWLIEKK
jgi:hypothetical protein